MRKAIIPLVIVAAVAAAGCSVKPEQAVTDTAAKTFKIDKVGLPGEGRGDYITVDADANRLYVTHSAVVHILELDTLKPLGEVSGLGAAHGVALDKGSGHGFVTSAEPDKVVMFDLATGKTLKSIPAGKKPDSILFDAASGRVFAFNNESSGVSVIDPIKGEVIKTITLPSGPEYSQTDGKGTVWANLEGDNAIAVIDAKKLEFVKLIKLDDCEGPAPLAYDAANNRLFSGCGNHMMKVVDAASGKVVASLPVGGDPDGIVYDPSGKRIFVANRDGAWTVIEQHDADRYTVGEPLKIDEYAKTIALDPKTNRLFSSTADLVWPAPIPGKKHLPEAKSGTFRLMVVSGS